MSLLALTACRSQPPAEARFLHVVVPDLLSDVAAPTVPAAGTLVSLDAVLRTASQLPGTAEVPELVVLTGVSMEAASPALPEQALARLVATLSSGKQILLVPRRESGAKPNRAFWDGVRGRAAAAGVALRDLTACYDRDSVGEADCSADLSGLMVRLVGFPAFPSGPVADTTWRVAVDKWVVRLDSILHRSAAKAVVVVSDIPDPILWPGFGVQAATAGRFAALVRSDPVIALVGVRPAPSAERVVPLGAQDQRSSDGGAFKCAAGNLNLRDA